MSPTNTLEYTIGHGHSRYTFFGSRGVPIDLPRSNGVRLQPPWLAPAIPRTSDEPTMRAAQRKRKAKPGRNRPAIVTIAGCPFIAKQQWGDDADGPSMRDASGWRLPTAYEGGTDHTHTQHTCASTKSRRFRLKRGGSNLTGAAFLPRSAYVEVGSMRQRYSFSESESLPIIKRRDFRRDIGWCSRSPLMNQKDL